MVLYNYLHLWYANFDPERSFIDKIKSTKDQIKNNAISRMRNKSKTSGAIEKEFEKWYQIKSQTELDGQIEISPQMQSILGEVDKAAADFRKKLKEAKTLAEKRTIINEAISFTDKILAEGANKGYVVEAALKQIEANKKQWEDALPLFRARAATNKERENAISEAIHTMETGTAGYTFELADNLGFLAASQKGLTNIHDLYINIGGNTDFKTTKEDPEFERELNLLADAISENNGQLAQGDQVLFYHANDGQGQINMTTHYAVFQDKNYTNISRVSIMQKTWEQLGVIPLYGANNLVNLAAGMGNANLNNKMTGYAKQVLQKHKVDAKGMGFTSTAPTDPVISQTELDLAWRTVRETVRLKAAADALASDLNTNFINQPNYYVIRSRVSGEVHVVGASTILDKISTDLAKGAENSMGIQFDYSHESWQNRTREKFWMWNIGFFNPGKNPEARLTRSNSAYFPILNKILTQEVRISLNFSNYFTNY